MSVRAIDAKMPPISTEDLRLLHQGYDLRNPDEIVPYLEAYPELVLLLLEGRRQISHFFADESFVVLSLNTDPEEGDQALYASILSGLPGEETEARLTRMWHEWWFEQEPSQPPLLFFDAL